MSQKVADGLKNKLRLASWYKLLNVILWQVLDLLEDACGSLLDSILAEKKIDGWNPVWSGIWIWFDEQIVYAHCLFASDVRSILASDVKKNLLIPNFFTPSIRNRCICTLHEEISLSFYFVSYFWVHENYWEMLRSV